MIDRVQTIIGQVGIIVDACLEITSKIAEHRVKWQPVSPLVIRHASQMRDEVVLLYTLHQMMLGIVVEREAETGIWGEPVEISIMDPDGQPCLALKRSRPGGVYEILLFNPSGPQGAQPSFRNARGLAYTIQQQYDENLALAALFHNGFAVKSAGALRPDGFQDIRLERVEPVSGEVQSLTLPIRCIGVSLDK